MMPLLVVLKPRYTAYVAICQRILQAHMSTYIHVWQFSAMYGMVSRRTSTHDTADAKIICCLT